MKKLFFILPVAALCYFLMTGQSSTDESPRWNIDPRTSIGLYPSGEFSSLPQTDNKTVFSTETRYVSTPNGIVGITPNFRVHPRPAPATQSEVPITRHPTNPMIMYGSANTFQGGNFCTGTYVTTNGGVNWYGNDTLIGINGTPFFNFGDPAPMIDKDGRFLISYITLSFSLGASFSTNNGLNWSPTLTFPGATSNADKNLSSTDDAPTSPFYGRAYTVYTEFGGSFTNRIVLSYSSNGGVNWSNVAPVSPPPSSGHHHQGCDVRVGPTGDVFVTWANCTTNGQSSTEDSLGIAKSTDGGVTWAFTRNNASNMNGIRQASFFTGIRMAGFPRIDIDRSGGSRNGWIYVATAEKNVAPATDVSDAIMHRSTDGGLTWTAVRVNQDTPGNGKYQYMSAIRVDEAGGINVVYYDSRNTPTNDSAQIYLSRSLDGGNTWTDILVSDHKFKPKPISGTATGYQGDYMGVTSGNGKVWPLWAEDITGSYQAWTTEVQVSTFPLNAFNLNTPSAGSRIQTLPNNTTSYTFTWDTAASTASYKWIFGNPTTSPRKITLQPSGNTLTVTSGQLDILLEGLGVQQGDSLVGQWDVWSFRNNQANDSLKAINGPRAITLKRGKPLLTAFNLSSPPNNTTIFTLITNSAIQNINWTKSGEAVKYKWIYASPNFSTTANIKFIVGANNNSYDTVLSVRNSKLDSLLAGAGVNVGDSLVGQWRVYGYSGTDSLASAQTNNLNLRRGIPPTVATSLDSIVVNLPINQSTSRNLVISNNGQFPLTFDLSESSVTLDNLNIKSEFTAEQISQMGKQPKGAPDIFHGSAQTDSSGGPDAGGYRWIDSDSPGGPVFNWVDITNGGGTQITSWTSGTGDDGSVIVPIPFTFNYYGTNYTQLKICTNGWAGFDVNAISNAYDNTTIPNTLDPNAALYCFWDDMDTRVTGSVWYKSEPQNNRFIVEWKDVPHYDPPAGGPYTYQIIIYNDGRIIYQYLSINSPDNSATIGTENSTGTVGLQTVFNNTYVHNNLAIKFERGLGWVEEVPSSGTIAPGGNQNVSVNFNATGLIIGSYTGILKVNTNDPITPVKNIRLRLNVGPVGIETNLAGVPSQFELNQNYPNPFNPTTVINFAIPSAGFVKLKIYDLLGKEVMTLVNEQKNAGFYNVDFNGENFASGIYFYKIEAGDFVQTRRMLLVK
ncbi:MAG: T9SS type A sorting domain-containing protein [bacterium]|nr:T9SS type A sorting domain-containing protein [bacterium]